MTTTRPVMRTEYSVQEPRLTLGTPIHKRGEDSCEEQCDAGHDRDEDHKNDHHDQDRLILGQVQARLDTQVGQVELLEAKHESRNWA
jgi:hypothetical protein